MIMEPPNQMLLVSIQSLPINQTKLPPNLIDATRMLSIQNQLKRFNPFRLSYNNFKFKRKIYFFFLKNMFFRKKMSIIQSILKI